MISKKDVQYVADLSRIHIPEEELDGFTQNFEKILHYIDKLNELDVDNVPPTSHVLALENVYREDEPETPLAQDQALSVAKHKHNGFFQVPKVIE